MDLSKLGGSHQWGGTALSLDGLGKIHENPNLKWMMTGGTPNLWKLPDGDFPGRHLLNCQGSRTYCSKFGTQMSDIPLVQYTIQCQIQPKQIEHELTWTNYLLLVGKTYTAGLYMARYNMV